MPILSIDTQDRARIDKVMAYANEHPFYEGCGWSAQELPDLRLILGDYECVFVYRHDHGKVYRHLLVRHPNAKPNMYPHPAAAFVIATEFGFTGWDGKYQEKIPDGWYSTVIEEEQAIVLGQEIDDAPRREQE